MSYYLALVLEAPEGGFDFICPDISGFAAHSDSREFGEAAAVAREVLAAHLALLLDNGGALPEARDPVVLRQDKALEEDFAEALTTIMLPALLPAGRAKRVNLSLDENTLSLIDASARDRNLTRSSFVAEACRHFASGGSVGDVGTRGSAGVYHLAAGVAVAVGDPAQPGGIEDKARTIRSGTGVKSPRPSGGFTLGRDAGTGAYHEVTAKGGKARGPGGSKKGGRAGSSAA